MYQQGERYYSSQPYHDNEEENNYNRSYGHNYQSYRSPNDPSIKGKIEQKYWRSKQKVIEKLGKDQDEFVIAGDAEVDARLEAFQHIKMTCIQLMSAIEFYQNKIFALSQDENEMGRFLRDQGATDKTKAGKMMIAVGKAQSFAAQQRLSLRTPLVRLFSELETFRFRAIQDTQLTVTKMEQARSDYRARLLWMADISKELDPDQNKRLDKFRDVQFQVKAAKKLFEKLKGDVIQKIDLLSASRCNLLSATLEPYQTAMVKFLNTTAKSYNQVYSQFQGYPSYQFQILKHILPNNGIIDDNEEEEEKTTKKSHRVRKLKASKQAEGRKEESKELKGDNNTVTEDKLISFDSSPSEENAAALQSVQEASTQQQTNLLEETNTLQQADLLGSLISQDVSPGFGEFTSEQDKKETEGFEDLLGKFEENNILAKAEDKLGDSLNLLGPVEAPKPQANLETTGGPSTIDDLLFGLSADDSQKNDIDLLSDVLNNQSLGITDAEQNSFSSQWQSMFGSDDNPAASRIQEITSVDNVDVGMQSKLFMPSFLMDQMRQKNPVAAGQGIPQDVSAVKDSAKTSKTPPNTRKSDKSKDMSDWFNLFADLDPLSNPDEIGQSETSSEKKQAC